MWIRRRVSGDGNKRTNCVHRTRARSHGDPLSGRFPAVRAPSGALKFFPRPPPPPRTGRRRSRTWFFSPSVRHYYSLFLSLLPCDYPTILLLLLFRVRAFSAFFFFFPCCCATRPRNTISHLYTADRAPFSPPRGGTKKTTTTRARYTAAAARYTRFTHSGPEETGRFSIIAHTNVFRKIILGFRLVENVKPIIITRPISNVYKNNVSYLTNVISWCMRFFAR